MQLLGSCKVVPSVFWVVSRVLLGCFGWCYYAVAIKSLGFSEWLLSHYYMVARVFQVVSRVLLCSCWEVFRSSPLLGRFCIFGGLCGVAMQLLGSCLKISRVFWVVSE